MLVIKSEALLFTLKLYSKVVIRRIIPKIKHHFISYVIVREPIMNSIKKNNLLVREVLTSIVKLQHHKQHLFAFFFSLLYFFVFYLSNVSH